MALLAPGTPAPTFKGLNLTGPEINLENYKGKKPIVMIFSGTRIDPSQIKSVTDMWKKYREKVEIMTASFKLPSVSMAKAFMQQMGAKFPALYDPKQDVYKLFGVENPVAVVIIGVDGNIIYSAESLDTKDTKSIEEALLANVK